MHLMHWQKLTTYLTETNMSYTPNNAWNNSPQTGLSSNPGPFLAEVMKNNDPLYSGRLLVYIPDFGGDPEQETSWHLVRYMSPYYGIQPLSNRLAAEPAGVTESYGMWMTPPDLGVKVLVMFINGDRSKGVWMGCLPEIGSHGAIPGNDKGDFDVFENQSAANNDIQSIPRPDHSTAPTFEVQGLDSDPQRGKTITTSSLRESPSKVFGMNTPSGHSFFMDDGAEDGTNKMLRLRTSAGNMIMMNDDTGFVYIINAKGTGWIELSPNGFVDIYGEQGISIGTPGNIDMHAAGNINMHAGQNIKMVAEKEAKFQGTEKAKIYGNNLYLQGSDSLEMYSCGKIKLTSLKGMHFKSEGNFILEGKKFRWNSGSAEEADQVAPDMPTEITRYTSTVLRAPNREPWKGHDESYEETPKGKTSGNAQLNALEGADPLDAFGGAGVTISEATQSINDDINILPEKFREDAFKNQLGIDTNVLQVEKELSDIGIDRIDIGEINKVIKTGSSIGSIEISNIAERIDITNSLSSNNVNDLSFVDSAVNTISEVSSIANAAGKINLKDWSLGGISNTLSGASQFLSAFPALPLSSVSLLPASTIATTALSIKANIQNADKLVGQLATPLTSISAIAGDILDIRDSGLLGISTLGQISSISGSLGALQRLGSRLGSGKVIGDLANNLPGDIGNITDTIKDLPINIPDTITDIIPPDLGDALSDAQGSLGNLNATQASTIIPATPGGGVAPSSAVGSDCTTPITRGSNTPANQDQANTGNSGNAHSGAPGNVVPPDELLNDPEWQAELANLKSRFPELDERDLYKIIQGESGFNSTIVNKDSGATGFFQFIPSTAKGLGTSTAEIQKMSPAQQLKVYGNYLGQFNYAGGPLGIMQAAPGTYSNLIRKFDGKYSNVPGNYEVYSTSSAAWRQNPGWRGPDGRITINSINQYYGKQTS